MLCEKASVLSLRGVHKTYRLGAHVVPALRGIDLDLQAGEMLALTGPSGSGKSTILNLAGLIDRPDQGQITLRGQVVADLGETEATLYRRDAVARVEVGTVRFMWAILTQRRWPGAALT